MIWFSAIVLSLLAIFFVIAPIFSKKQKLVSNEGAVPAFLIDQLDELERDKNAGLISADEVTAAQMEIKRRILSAARRKKKLTTYGTANGRLSLLVCGLFVPVLAFGYYFSMGEPSVPSIAFTERQNERQEVQKVVLLTHQLRDRLRNDPSGGPTEGWLLLGRTYMKMGQFEDAAQVFKNISTRPGSTSATWSMLAESLISLDNGIVTPQAEDAIEKAMELDAENPAATFYRALAWRQTGREVEAYRLLVDRLSRATSFEPWMNSLVAQANKIGSSLGKPEITVSEFVQVAKSGPTAAEMAAAREMSEEDRASFIKSMVERLADRLKDEPDDLDGWLRLAIAYSVLGERKQAIRAYERADDLMDNKYLSNDPRRHKINKALSELQG